MLCPAAAFADGIGISPNKIDFGVINGEMERQESEFIIYNPNDFDISYSIKSHDSNIMFEPIEDVINANKNKAVKIILFPEKKGNFSSIAIIRIKSENSIIPAVGLRVNYVAKGNETYDDEDDEDFGAGAAVETKKPNIEKEEPVLSYLGLASIIMSIIGVAVFVILFLRHEK